jgi:hypothetical protein
MNLDQAITLAGSMRKFKILIWVVLFIAAALRLAFPADIEYKGDEKFMFAQSQAIGVTLPYPDLGMRSSIGLRNPALSLWLFVALARLFHAMDPIALTCAVECLNIGAFFLLFWVIEKILPAAEQREPWMWSLVLAAVNPFAVLFHRKIWAQDTLPFFCVALLAGWFKRETITGAFAWGFFGVILGQIHMSGFFLAASLLFFTIFLAHRFDVHQKVHWPSWILGSVIGAIPLITWIQYVINFHGTVRSIDWSNMLTLRYWYYWLTDTFGFGLNYSLGKYFEEFVQLPWVAAAHLSIALAAAAIFYFAIRRWSGGQKLPFKGESALALTSAGIGCGILMVMARISIHRYYLIATFPFEFYWLARISCEDGFRGQCLLTVIALSELTLSISFLFFIHLHHGAFGADYGIGYQWQKF